MLKFYMLQIVLGALNISYLTRFIVEHNYIVVNYGKSEPIGRYLTGPGSR